MTKDEGIINHCVSVRYRVIGSGLLLTTLETYDPTVNSSLANINMSTVNARYENILANFSQEKMMVRFGTELIDEFFTVSKIIAFIKPTATGYPQL